jgi:hypothetical protein
MSNWNRAHEMVENTSATSDRTPVKPHGTSSNHHVLKLYERMTELSGGMPVLNCH